MRLSLLFCLISLILLILLYLIFYIQDIIKNKENYFQKIKELVYNFFNYFM